MFPINRCKFLYNYPIENPYSLLYNYYEIICGLNTAKIVFYTVKGVFDLKSSRFLFVSLSAVLVVLIMLLATVPAFAAASDGAVTPDKSQFEYKILSGKVRITKYTGSAKKIIIPDYIDGSPVTMIMKPFSGNATVEYVKLPATLTNVVPGCFSLCSNLTYIDADTQNEAYKSVDGVLFSKDGTKLVAFPGGKSGTYTVPNGVTAIGNYAFDHCYKLTSVSMYNSVTEIGAYAFSYCWNLKSIQLSINLKTLGKEALAYNPALKEIHLPGSLTSIGADAVLAYLDSNDHKVYYFINGIYCVPGTYSYEYVKALGIPEGKYLKSEEAIEYKRGDVNGDGAIDLIDVDILLRAATGTVTLGANQKKAGNLDNSADGKITTADARRLLRYVSRITKTL